MEDLNIVLGAGFQSVQKQGVTSTLKTPKLIENYIVEIKEPKFMFDAKFCESSEELHRELNYSLGLSLGVQDVSADFKYSLSKKDLLQICIFPQYLIGDRLH